MASSYTDLGIEKMATGENAGTWGTKTNTNLDIIEKAIAGYVEQAVTSGGTTQLTITDGDATESTSVARHAVIKLTGTITGNSIVTVPDSVEKVYIVTNGTSGAYTVQFKTASGTGITFGVSEKTTRLVYSDGTNIVDAGFGGNLDMEGRELVLDADGDTTITADTDDQIDIKIAGADDFQFTANTFTAQSGSTIAAQALTATTVTASGIVKTDDTTEATSTTDGSLQTDGGLSVAKDAVFGDDVKLLSDSAVLNFGADSDVSLTHVADTALLLNAAMRLQFRDSGLYIGSNADGDLDIVSDGTAVDSINLESAGGITLDAGTAGSGIIYEDDGTEMARIHNSSSNVILETKVSDADFSIKGNDGGSTITPLTFDMSDAGKATFSGNVVVTGDLTVSGDDLTMGTNTSGYVLVADGTNYNPVAISGDITIASNGAVTIAATSVENSMLAGSIADSKLSTISTADKVAGGAIQIDSGTDGTSITLADTDKFLVDDGGTTKYINASQINAYTSAAVALDDISTGDAAVTLATSSGNITIDAQAGDTDIIFKGTDSSSDITALTLDMSEAGAATFNDKVVATELDISGDVDVDGTLEADAITVDGTALATYIRDTVGTNMLSSNTETGIAVTYDTSNDNIDFALEASQTVFTSITNTSLVVGRDADNDIDFATDNTILFRTDGADQIKLINGALAPVADDDIDLGTSSLQFKDGYFDGTLEADAITVGGTAVLTGGAETAITSVLNTSLVIGRDADNDIDFGTDNEVTFRAGAQDQIKLTDGVLAPLSDNDVDLGTSSLEFKDGYFDGTLYCDTLNLNGTDHTSIEDPTALAIALG